MQVGLKEYTWHEIRMDTIEYLLSCPFETALLEICTRLRDKFGVLTTKHRSESLNECWRCGDVIISLEIVLVNIRRFCGTIDIRLDVPNLSEGFHCF